ncbi:hypothetical protein SARC_00590 [Sphaeroforma arctica JP610]|uniref:NADH:flavin oxidoreductase/NADH oxidase N-terminal domain-containing protein n=1 Tax=Sphaeroforma arctica JP610 TaxID=667725 RepID=A0A0L0GEE7_9EUKA|nr:hypothetical protein SARC_00590 [Sphaeroforma arctica JP610]KNC87261.1 hypothetical protein SARC_00590 [Sphaeroforma arctica JP610]|eukprot:XP_014161163.1 hypothetical protein SARC_00590 [Sphaeroforma arctica JP610]
MDTSLTLPCGAILKNRIAKAAMTEGLATFDGRSTDELCNLYRVWAEGGAGLLITGNVQIDSEHLERIGNVMIEGTPDEDRMARLRKYAEAGTRNNTHLWAQISHAGRQTNPTVNQAPKAMSAVPVKVPGFGNPVELTIAEIEQIVERFATAALALKAAGFTGIQIHGAHGYLIASSLSPLANLRTDKYGGSLENRARMLLDIIHACRAAVGPAFPISVKINSADFQHGGFTSDDCFVVVDWLQKASVDLIEISGGTYESPEMFSGTKLKAEHDAAKKKEEETNALKQQSTLAREAYFVKFAQQMREKVNIPLMVTGGFRTRSVMEHAVATQSVDVVGIARPMCIMTDAPQKLLDGTVDILPSYEDNVGVPLYASIFSKFRIGRSANIAAVVMYLYAQIYAIARNGVADENMSRVVALYNAYTHDSKLLPEYTAWRKEVNTKA